ncbi:hypothetical protein R6Q59_011788 [Mikania micrantha]
MNFELSDSSGTDDDLPPPHQQKFRNSGPVTGNGRTMAVGNAPFPRIQNDMEKQIHLIEQEAYSSVLRAFKAQSDAITWGFDEDNSSDPLIGRKVWTRWPEDNNFYEAVITDFNPVEGRHALVYDGKTPNEAWEWVNLREISPNDIRWKWEDVGISNRGGRSGSGRGIKSSTARVGTNSGTGRGRVVTKGQSKKEVPPKENGMAKKPLNSIEILHTDTLVKELDKVFSSSTADPMDIEKARKVLKEHEQALVDAIAKLEGASDGESDHDHLSRKHEAVEGSDGNKVAVKDQKIGGQELQ